MFEDLKGKVAIITGAKQGMGKTHALLLAKAGAKVVVSDISQDECQKVADEIKSAGGEAIAMRCDISNKNEVDEMIGSTIKEFGKIDILVNNAGYLEYASFLEMTEAQWDKTMNINLKGYFLCSQAAAKEMAKQKSGAIVNIASIAMGQVGVGFPSISQYCASKGGIVALAEAMAIELAPYNIRVNTIAPGMIDTPMANIAKTDKKQMDAMLSRLPIKRPGKPEEISSAVLFLASDASSYMTGSVVVVDGGWLAN